MLLIDEILQAEAYIIERLIDKFVLEHVGHYFAIRGILIFSFSNGLITCNGVNTILL